MKRSISVSPLVHFFCAMDAGGRTVKITGPFTSYGICTLPYPCAATAYKVGRLLHGLCGSCSCDFQGDSDELDCWGLRTLQAQQTLTLSISGGPCRTWWLGGGSNHARAAPRQLWSRTSTTAMQSALLTAGKAPCLSELFLRTCKHTFNHCQGRPLFFRPSLTVLI